MSKEAEVLLSPENMSPKEIYDMMLDYVSKSPKASPVNRDEAPFKDYKENTETATKLVDNKTILEYLKGKRFFDLERLWSESWDMSIKEIGKFNLPEGISIKIPLDSLVYTAAFKDWGGRDEEALNNKKAPYSKYLKDGKELSSLNVIKHYASLSTEVPSVDYIHMYIQPNGTVFFGNLNGDSHRIAAAILKGNEYIEAKNLKIIKIDQNFF